MSGVKITETAIPFKYKILCLAFDIRSPVNWTTSFCAVTPEAPSLKILVANLQATSSQAVTT